MKITINVTQEDINNGVQTRCTDCPVALASSRALRCNTWVEQRYLVIPHINPVMWFDAWIAEWINKFDNSFQVKPFSFQLDVPKELVKYCED